MATFNQLAVYGLSYVGTAPHPVNYIIIRIIHMVLGGNPSQISNRVPVSPTTLSYDNFFDFSISYFSNGMSTVLIAINRFLGSGTVPYFNPWVGVRWFIKLPSDRMFSIGAFIARWDFIPKATQANCKICIFFVGNQWSCMR